MPLLDVLEDRTPSRTAKQYRKRSRPLVDYLEARILPTGTIGVTNAAVVNGNDQALTAVNIGEWVYIQVNFTTLALPSNATYRVGFMVNGLTLHTGYLTWGAGNSGTSSWYAYWGSFIASPGTNQVMVTVDPDHSVALTTYADTTISFTFNTVAPAVGSFISPT